MKPLLAQNMVLKTLLLSIWLTFSFTFLQQKSSADSFNPKLLQKESLPVSRKMPLVENPALDQLTSPFLLIGEHCLENELNSEEYDQKDCFGGAIRVAKVIESYLERMMGQFGFDSEEGTKNANYVFTPLKMSQTNNGEYSVQDGSPDEEKVPDNFLDALMNNGHFKAPYDNKEFLLRDFLKNGECQSALRAFKVSVSPKANFIVVLVIQPKPNGIKKAVMSVKTAALFWKKTSSSFEKINLAFSENEVKSIKEIERSMSANSNLGDYVAIEIPTKAVFDRGSKLESNCACNHSFMIVKSLVHLFKVFNFDDIRLKMNEGQQGDFNRLTILRENMKKPEYLIDNLDENGIDKTLFVEESTPGANISKYDESEEFRRLNAIEPDNSDSERLQLLQKGNAVGNQRNLETKTTDLSQFFTTSNFLKLIKMTSNTLRWPELSRLSFALYSKFAEFEFEHVVETRKCPEDENESEGKEKEMIILKSEGQRLMTLSLDVFGPELSEKDEDLRADFDTYICLDVSAELSLSSLSRMSCYSLEVEAVKNDKSPEYQLKLQVQEMVSWKILRFLVGNYADVVEDLCMHLKTRLRPASFRKYFYTLQATKADKNSIQLNAVSDDNLRIGLLDSDRPSLDQIEQVQSRRKGDNFLMIKEDAISISEKLKMKVSIPLPEYKQQERFFTIDIEVYETNPDSFLLRLKSFNRNFEVQIGKYWAADQSTSEKEKNKTSSPLELKHLFFRSWHSDHLDKELNQLLFAFLDDKIGKSIAEWISQFFQADDGMVSVPSIPASNYKLDKTLEFFQETQCNSFPATASLIFYIMMELDYFDSQLSHHLLDDKQSKDTLSQYQKAQELKVAYKNIVRERSVQIDSTKVSFDEADGISFLTDDDVQKFSGKKPDLVIKLLDQLTLLEDNSMLGNVFFIFQSSQDSMRLNENGFSDQVLLKLTLFEDYFWNSIHLKFDTYFFSVEYLFAAQNFNDVSFWVGKAISEVVDQQAKRMELSEANPGTHIIKFEILTELIQKFLVDQKIQSQFCKVKVDDPKLAVYKVLSSKSGTPIADQGTTVQDCDATATDDYKDQSYFEISEGQVTHHKPQNKTQDGTPATVKTKKTAFFLEFVLKQSPDPTSESRYSSSSYQFYSRYDYDYLKVVDMYLKRGLFHLGVFGNGKSEGTEDHLVESKLKKKKPGSKKVVRELLNKESPQSALEEKVEEFSESHSDRSEPISNPEPFVKSRNQQSFNMVSKMRDKNV